MISSESPQPIGSGLTAGCNLWGMQMLRWAIIFFVVSMSLVSSASPAYPRRPEGLLASYFFIFAVVFLVFLVLALLDGQAIFDCGKRRSKIIVIDS